MTKATVATKTKARRVGVKKQGGRTRTATLPDYQMPAIVPLLLFTTEEVWRLSADAAKQNPALQLRQASDAELIPITQLLHQAFQWAVQCTTMQEWEAEPQRKRRWYEQVARRADDFLKALGLEPDECRDPTRKPKPGALPRPIHDFRQSLDRMAGARTDLPDQLDALSRVAWGEQGPELEQDGIDPEGRCQYRARASFLIDRLPRTLALASMLARWQLEQLERRPRYRASGADLFSRELFKILAGAHEAIYRSKPLTRIKSGETIGGSIDWAKTVVNYAADVIERSPHPVPFHGSGDADSWAAQEEQFLAQARTLAAPYVARLRELAGLSNRRVGDLLERGWSMWKKQAAASAR